MARPVPPEIFVRRVETITPGSTGMSNLNTPNNPNNPTTQVKISHNLPAKAYRAVSCVDGPRLARGNAACRTEVACSHVSGLFTQSKICGPVRNVGNSSV